MANTKQNVEEMNTSEQKFDSLTTECTIVRREFWDEKNRRMVEYIAIDMHSPFDDSKIRVVPKKVEVGAILKHEAKKLLNIIKD